MSGPLEDWCQCEHVAHGSGAFMCCCSHTSDGVRFGTFPTCPIHVETCHPYAAQRRVEPVRTAWGTFNLCKPCRDAGHLIVGV